MAVVGVRELGPPAPRRAVPVEDVHNPFAAVAIGRGSHHHAVPFEGNLSSEVFFLSPCLYLIKLPEQQQA